jgi:hypothetical protein
VTPTYDVADAYAPIAWWHPGTGRLACQCPAHKRIRLAEEKKP